VPRAEVRVDMWQIHKVRLALLTSGHALPGERSQHSIEFSHLMDSRDKSVKVRRFNL
jgi:hypothetical protein